MAALAPTVAAPAASPALLAGGAALVPSPTVVISQVYGGGNNANAVFQNDFVELFNRGTVDQPLAGWSLQYASTMGTSWTNSVVLSGTIPAGRYFLVRLSGGTTNGAPLPEADLTNTGVNMSGTAGKVVLLNTTTPPTSGTACPSGSSVVDIVGYGTGTTCSETAPTATLSNTTAAIRAGAGCVDTDNNAADFAVATPTPRTSATPRNLCAGDSAPSVASTTPAGTATNVPVDANVSITFSEPVNVTGSWFTISCSLSGTHAAAVSGGPTTYALDPAANFANDETCTVTVVGTNVSDQDTVDPPDAMESSSVFSFATASVVDDAPTVTATTPAANAAGVALGANVAVTFSEPVTVAAGSFTITCTTSGAHAYALTGGPTTYTLNPNGDFVEGERCTVRVVAAQVSDADTNDPPDTMAADYVFTFDTIAPIPIGTVQGPISDATDGATHRSPFAPPPANPGNPCATGSAGDTVAIRGVIYQKTLARTSAGANQHGFFIQNTAATRDADATTSDGIFVFVGSSTTLTGGYAPVVGDEVVLSGRVTEFNCLTQLSSASVLRVIRSGVPVDVELPPFEAFPPDDSEDAERYWERREGMRGRAPVGSITVGRRQVFGATTTMDGEDAFIAPTHPVALRANEYARRTYRDPHPMDNRPELWDDANGFRIILGSMGVKSAANDNTALIAPARTYDRIATAPAGGVYFSFLKYIIHPEAQITLAPGPDPSMNAPPTAPLRPQEYSIADYNVENLYDFRDDPFDGCDFVGNPGCPGVNPPFNYVPAGQLEYEVKLRDIATQIVEDLHSPELILTQEGEDQDICTVVGGSMSCSPTNNADGKPDTLQELALAIAARGGPAYDAAYDRDGADDRGIVSAIMYRTDRVQLLPAPATHPVLGSAPTVSYRSAGLAYNTQVQNPKVLNAVLPADVDRSTGTDGSNVFTRPPQVGLFRIWEQPGRTGTSFDVYAISNHFSSGPDSRVGQRREQARYNAAITAAIQSVDPAARIDIAGDFNVFPRPDDPFRPGHPQYPSDQLAPLYDAGLLNLWDALAADAPASAYSYVFDMNAQTLDMHFVSPSLRSELRQFRMAHVNADYPTEFDSPGARGISDHDPGVARFAAPAAAADLTLTKVASSEPVGSGSILTYTLTVSNRGPSTATGVRVTDTLPDGLLYVSSSASQGTCEGGRTVTCSLGQLASGASARVTIDVRATRPGAFTNTAEVDGGQADANPGNDRASATTTVVPPPSARPTTPRGCTLTAAPRTLVTGRRAVVRVTAAMTGPREPAANAAVRLRGAGIDRSARTSAGGTVRVALRPMRAGTIRVTAPQLARCSARVTVRPRSRNGVGAALTGRSSG